MRPPSTLLWVGRRGCYGTPMSNLKEINLTGPAGHLEAQFTEASDTPIACAVLCHPHPQYGGSMQDAVLATAESQFTQHNVSTLRFNFRGVGGSDGQYDNGIGEAEDIKAATAWMQQQYPRLPCILLGYSFGAAAAWRAASADAHNAPNLAGLWLVAPPVAMLDMTGAPPQAPIRLFHPDADDFTSLDTLREWSNRLAGEPPELAVIAGANHFFGGAQESLATALAAPMAQL